jgi:hypothetical protein
MNDKELDSFLKKSFESYPGPAAGQSMVDPVMAKVHESRLTAPRARGAWLPFAAAIVGLVVSLPNLAALDVTGMLGSVVQLSVSSGIDQAWVGAASTLAPALLWLVAATPLVLLVLDE